MSGPVTLDSGVLRGVMTVLLIVSFVAIVVYAYSARRRAAFESVSRLPLEEDSPESQRPQDLPE